MIKWKIIYNCKLHRFLVYRSKGIDLCGNVKAWVIRASFDTIKECDSYTGYKLNFLEKVY